MHPLPDYTRLTEEELACRGNDPRAFDELHRRLHPRLCGYLRTLVKDAHVVDDLAADTWLKALPTIRSGTFKGNFLGWLFRIGRNTAIDWSNRKKSTALTAEQAAGLPNREDSEMDDPLLEHVARLKQCQEKLKPPRGQIIRLICEGLKPAEIAEKLKLSSESVHKLKFTAMQDLRSCMGVESK